MKKILYILLIIAAPVIGQDIGGTYYVAHPDSTYSGMGTPSDLNDGSYANPWVTWNKAFETAEAGDTVYLRGGVYYSTSSPTIANSGTRNLPICIFTYPGESPILDCSVRSGLLYNAGIQMTEKQFIHFKGLTIRNVWQSQYSESEYSSAWGVESGSGANLTFENMTVHNVAGRGFWVTSGAWGAYTSSPKFDSDTTRFINCDVYDLCDTINYFIYPTGYEFQGWAEGDTAYRPGNAADAWKTIHYAGNYISWEGCRAWNYPDDGCDPTPVNGAERVFKNCWAMSSMKYYDICEYRNYKSLSETYETSTMEGNGFKLNNDDGPYTENSVQVTKCLAVFNLGQGFYEIGGHASYGRYYNNTAYKNATGFSSTIYSNAIYRNNISTGATDLTAFTTPFECYLPSDSVVEVNNTWRSTSSYPYFGSSNEVTVTDDDFVETDSATLVALFTAPRNADGSLPAFPLQLAEGSDLIDAGATYPSEDDIGSPDGIVATYNGTAPDIGAFEYGTASTPTTGRGRAASSSGGNADVINGKPYIIAQ